MKQTVHLALSNPNRDWVLKELEKLYLEWTAWLLAVAQIEDQPFDKQKQSEVFADGEDKMKTHAILQAKTLTFLNNNIEGHGFIEGFDGHGCDRTDLRLKYRVKHRLYDLDLLRASLPYAKVPDSYWKQKAKMLMDKVVEKGPEAGAAILESALKNPLGEG